MFRRKSNNKGNYTQQNRIKLVRGGREYFDLLIRMIGEARYTIHLQYYIFLEDETGKMVAAALREAAERGVKVYLHIDAYASKRFSKKFLSELDQAGVHFKRFEPLLKSRHFYFGRRLHHKVFVTDGLYSLVGGINISDHYNDLEKRPAWLDMALYCEGEASMMLHRICRSMWGKKIARDNIPPENKELFLASFPKEEERLVAVSRNDWVKKKSEVWRNYAYMFNHSKKEIWIMCSYFLPGWAFRRQMSRAVKRGVKIKVILAGTSDIMIAKHAERFLYEWLFKRNIEIYEYQRSVLHAKVALYDNEWSTIGSFNVNNISTYASLELNVDVKSEAFTKELKRTLQKIMANDCQQVTPENYRRSLNIFRRWWQRLCYGFINVTLRVFTFYFRQE